MNTLSFTNIPLKAYLATAPHIGSEIKSDKDPRLRGWVRKRGLCLGARLSINKKRRVITIGYLGDISMVEYHREVASIISKVQLGIYSDESVGGMTCQCFFESFVLPHAKREHKSTKNVLTVWNRVDSVIKSMTLSQIKRVDIERNLDRLTDSGLKPATVNRTRSLLLKLFNLAIEHEMIDKNPVRFIKPLKENNKRTRVMTGSEFSAYLRFARGDVNVVHRSALILAVTSGARIGEIRSLLVSDIAEDYKSFKVRKTKNTLDRVCYCSTEGTKAIRAVLELSTNQYLFSSDSSGTGYIGYPVNTHARILGEMDKVGVLNGHLTIHDLRRSFGSLTYQLNGDVHAVQRLLGHSSIGVTTDHYVHADSNHLQGVADSLDILTNLEVANENG